MPNRKRFNKLLSSHMRNSYVSLTNTDIRIS